MAAADDYARLHLWVSGRVQGVFFRGAAADDGADAGDHRMGP